ncbi:hypothetical protein [Iodobacter fluviatilis]|uniref:HAMP domain-containing protein n=1 Tax=Iodobacter fluviatilis TaxID=537 RepID=A0A377Q6K9_9NEIS|nr:hypothetical protein [Iodobacter fluviatilis]TCU87009.1 hypothetical protein EV682_105134 [Iodobacter fluviatilis]STQ90340.1 Uncharacterised protein [Iodobacter fluviatilis]
MVSLARQEKEIYKNRHYIWWRVSLLLVLVIAFVLAIISFLNYSNYRKTYLDLSLSRHLVLAKELRQIIEAGLNIGIKPSENLNLLPTINELMRSHAGIHYIFIIDENGNVTGEGGDPAVNIIFYKNKIKETQERKYWQEMTSDTIQIGIVFLNNFNIKTGAVIIGYDRLAIENATHQMRNKLVLDMLLTFVLLAVLIFGGVFALTRKFANELAQVSGVIDSAIGAATPLKVEGHVLSGNVAQDINDFTALGHQLAQKMTELEREISPVSPVQLPQSGGGK